MDYLNLLKRAFKITWRYRALWIFGFLLALCSGGGGGGNFNPPTNLFQGSGDFYEAPGPPEISPEIVIVLATAIICLFLMLILLSIIISLITRTALIGMVGQIQAAGQVTAGEGWRMGCSSGAWRLFLVGLLIGIPLFIVNVALLLLAFSPLLLLITQETAFIVTGVILTILAVIFVILLLVALNAIIGPVRELAWRRTVLDRQGVLASLTNTFSLIRQRLKDVVLVWLLMFGAAFGWGIVSLIVVLPVTLIAALIIGGLPAALVYGLSGSIMGAAAAGLPLGLLVLILLGSAAQGFYLIFQSTVWTLAYLELKESRPEAGQPERPGPESGDASPETAAGPVSEEPATPTERLGPESGDVSPETAAGPVSEEPATPTERPGPESAEPPAADSGPEKPATPAEVLSSSKPVSAPPKAPDQDVPSAPSSSEPAAPDSPSPADEANDKTNHEVDKPKHEDD